LGAFGGTLYGQAMDYLGIEVGTMGAYQGLSKDSTYISGSGSSVGEYTVVETLRVDYDFTYSGYPARGITRTTYAISPDAADTTITTMIDTVYEIANDLHRLMVIGKTSDTTYLKADVLALQTPLSVGASWTLGIAGTTFTADIDGDTNYAVPDTLIFNVDSVYVLSVGSMTVPAGTFDSVYTIYIKLRGDFWSSAVYDGTGSSSAAWSEVMMRDYYIYWVPGLGYVKDSLYQYASWSYLFVTIENYRWSANELTGYFRVGAKEAPPPSRPTFIVSEGGIYLERRATVYDVMGRVVFYGDGFVSLPRGAYLIREGDRTYRVLVR